MWAILPSLLTAKLLEGKGLVLDHPSPQYISFTHTRGPQPHKEILTILHKKSP